MGQRKQVVKNHQHRPEDDKPSLRHRQVLVMLTGHVASAKCTEGARASRDAGLASRPCLPAVLAFAVLAAAPVLVLAVHVVAAVACRAPGRRLPGTLTLPLPGPGERVPVGRAWRCAFAAGSPAAWRRRRSR